MLLFKESAAETTMVSVAVAIKVETELSHFLGK
jgi:hypothetical protein